MKLECVCSASSARCAAASLASGTTPPWLDCALTEAVCRRASRATATRSSLPSHPTGILASRIAVERCSMKKASFASISAVCRFGGN